MVLAKKHVTTGKFLHSPKALTFIFKITMRIYLIINEKETSQTIEIISWDVVTNSIFS